MRRKVETLLNQNILRKLTQDTEIITYLCHSYDCAIIRFQNESVDLGLIRPC